MPDAKERPILEYADDNVNEFAKNQTPIKGMTSSVTISIEINAPNGRVRQRRNYVMAEQIQLRDEVPRIANVVIAAALEPFRPGH